MPPELSPNQLVPFRWPSAWTAANLSLLAGGPINCVLVDAPGHPVAEPARAAGLVVREWSSLGAAPLAKVRWDGDNPITALTEVAWPQIKPVARGPNAESGPTGAPWIDSTSWVARLAASRAPSKQVWLAFDPPSDLILNATAYRLAIVDCAATGARWMMSLDPKLAAGLASDNTTALATWRQMKDTLAFFETHPAWRSYRAQGPLGVISTFSGDNEFMATEVLNLAARRNLLYRVIDRTVAEAEDLTGLRAVLWVDPQTPTPPLVSKLTAFARAGGLLILSHAAALAFKGERPLESAVSGYEVRALGKGAVAAAARDWDDPYFVALDAHSLVSRRYDPVRMFNASSLWVHYSVQPRGTASLIQLVNFSSRPATDVSFRIQYPHRDVRIRTLEANDPKLLQPARVGRDAEYYMPAFSIYAALEVTA